MSSNNRSFVRIINNAQPSIPRPRSFPHAESEPANMIPDMYLREPGIAPTTIRQRRALASFYFEFMPNVDFLAEIR